MRRKIRTFFWLTFTLILLLLILIFVIISHTNFPAKGITRLANQMIPAETNLRISIGAVRGDLFNGLNIFDISLFTQREEQSVEIFHIDEAHLRYHLTDLLGGTFLFSEVILIEPSGLIDPAVLQTLRHGGQKESTPSSGDGRHRLLGVEHLDVKRGTVLYRNSSGGTYTFHDIFLQGRLRGDDQGIFVLLRSASVYWQERDLRGEDVKLNAFLIGDSLLVDRIHLKTSNSSIHGSGTMTNLSDPRLRWRLEESTISLEELSRVLGLSEGTLRGTVTLETSVNGPLDHLHYEAKLAGLLNEYRFDLRLADTHLSGSGGLSIDHRPRYNAEITFRGLDLTCIHGVGLETDLNGNVSLVGEEFGSDRVDIEAELRVDKSRLDRYSIDACGGRFRLSGFEISTVGPAVLRMADMRWQVDGRLQYDGCVQAHNTIEVGTISQITSVFRLPHFDGAARVQATVSGDISDPDIEGDVHFDSLSNSYLFFTDCTVAGTVSRRGERQRGFMRISGTHGSIGSIPLTELNGHVSFEESTLIIDSLSAINDEAAVTIGGTLQLGDESRQLTLDTFRSRFRDYEITNTDTVYLVLDQDGALAGRGRFATEEGGFDFSGSIDSLGYMNGELAFESMDIFPIMRTVNVKENIGGTVNGTVTVAGHKVTPRCDLDLVVMNGRVSTISFDTLICSLNYDDQQLNVSRLELVNEQRDILRCNGFIPLMLSFSQTPYLSALTDNEVSFSLRLMNFDVFPVSQLIQSDMAFHGMCSAEMVVGQSMRKPRMTVNCRLEGACYDELQLGDIESQFQYAAGRLTVQYLESSYRGTEYASTGVVALNLAWPFTKFFSEEDSIDVTFGMAGEIPAGLIPLFTDDIQSLSGDMDVRSTISGVLGNPILNGDLTLQGGILQLADLENPMTEVHAEMTVRDTLVTINRLEGKMGREAIEKENVLHTLVRWLTFRKKEPPGQLSLLGTVNFANLDRLIFDLDLEGKKLFLRPMRQNIDLVADAGLHLSGIQYPSIAGDVIISQGHVKEAFKPREQVQSDTDEEDTEGLGPSLDLHVHIPGNFWVEGSDYIQELSVELRGDVQVLKRRTGPELQFFGTAETMRGKYHIYGNVFRMTQGTINFGGIAEFNPNLDIEAETRVGNELIYLNLSGTLLQPEVRLWSQSGYSEKDIIALLTLGTTSAAVDTIGVSGAFESKATNVLGRLIEGELARKARRELGVDTFELSGGEGTQLAPNETQLTVGKYLSPRVYLEYSRRLAAESEQEVELEYRLNRHLSFLGTRDRRGLYHLQLQLKLDY